MNSVYYGCSGVILAALIASIPSIPSAFASNNAYDSGYDHGCDDAGISDPDDRYINQPERGPSFHTGAFMDGYNAGFNSCSRSGGDNDNNDNNDNDNGGSDNNDGRSREDLIDQLCRYIRTNPEIAELAATALGFPGAGAAASVLCSLGN